MPTISNDSDDVIRSIYDRRRQLHNELNEVNEDICEAYHKLHHGDGLVKELYDRRQQLHNELNEVNGDIHDDVVNDNDIIDLTLNDDDRIPNDSESESEEHSPTTLFTIMAQINDTDDTNE